MVEDMTKEDWLFGTAEECGELIQASSKMYRVLTNRNFTPVSYNDAIKGIVEEIADVEWYIDHLLDVLQIDRRIVQKEYATKDKRAEERGKKVDFH